MRLRWLAVPVALVSWAALAQPAAREPIFTTTTGGPRLRVVARARTGIQPKSVRVSPDGTRLAVCNFGRPDEENVTVHDAATLERLGSVSFEGNAVESAFSADGRTLWVSNFRRNVVEEIDFERLAVRREIEVGSHPKTVAISPDERTLYVANYFGHSVSVVDLASGRERRRLPTGDRPRGMTVLDDGTLLVADFRGDQIHVFEPDGGERATWRACRFPRDLLVPADGSTVFLTCSLGHIAFLSPSQGQRPLGLAPTGRNPRSIAASRDGRWVGVANFTSNDVTLIDTVGRTHRRTSIPGASGVVGLAMHPGPEPRVYATSWDTHEVILLAAPNGGALERETTPP